MKNIIKAALTVLFTVFCVVSAFTVATSCNKSGNSPLVSCASDPQGSLDVTGTTLIADDSGFAKLIATYKNPKGLFDPTAIQIKNVAGTIEGNSKIFTLSTQPGTYNVTAGKLSITVHVIKQ